MNDPRVKDAIRQIPVLIETIEAQSKRIRELKDDMVYVKEMLRSIKKSVVRKYKGKVERKTI